MAPKRRYINSKYLSPLDSEDSADGHYMWLSARLRRGKREKPPTVIWYATRRENSDDGQYIEDPTFGATKQIDGKDMRWVCVDLPKVTGVRWTFEAVSRKVGKKEKTIPIAGEYQTWKRLFLNVSAPNEKLYNLFKKALPKIKRAFDHACIEIAENKVTIGGTPQKKDDNSSSDGRALGDVYELMLGNPATSSFDIDYQFRVLEGGSNCASVLVKKGTIMVCLDAYSKWNKDDWISAIEIHTHIGQQRALLLSIHHAGQLESGHMPSVKAKEALRGVVSSRVTNRIITINTTSAPMKRRWDGKGWNTPRETTLTQALAAGLVTFKIKVDLSAFGGTNGEYSQQQKRISTYTNEGENRLASVICHEIGHACGLVGQQSTKKYNAVRRVYPSTMAKRSTIATRVGNPHYYAADLGGIGPHCSKGAERVPSCVTTSGESYEPGNGDICLMYHASAVSVDDEPLTNDIRFCETCIRQLRGR